MIWDRTMLTDKNMTDHSELAFRAFIRATGLFRGVMDPYFSQFGISGPQWGVLRQLHRAEGEGHKGLRLADLGQRLLVKPPSVTNLVDRLERMGLVARKAESADHRAKQVSLTRAGRQLVMRILKQHPTQIRTVLAGLNESEQAELCELMKKFASHLEAMGNGKARYHGERGNGHE